eukprot:TRINITY_DN113423_c0_g1_i1.p1 TRINITY_DN113423_c0_g1~~TRINITY_DN113423_c0_g1_i1.p1  ORF type:complete len:179 (-),score=33.10 TRINITY_DN113423_c0_g1_i1:173-709(-)
MLSDEPLGRVWRRPTYSNVHDDGSRSGLVQSFIRHCFEREDRRRLERLRRQWQAFDRRGDVLEVAPEVEVQQVGEGQEGRGSRDVPFPQDGQEEVEEAQEGRARGRDSGSIVSPRQGQAVSEQAQDGGGSHVSQGQAEVKEAQGAKSRRGVHFSQQLEEIQDQAAEDVQGRAKEVATG